jgi:hypothetical protein
MTRFYFYAISNINQNKICYKYQYKLRFGHLNLPNKGPELILEPEPNEGLVNVTIMQSAPSIFFVQMSAYFIKVLGHQC